ncbi:hypothetical protein [Methanoregula sp.]|uniref:hypothetical protein n=1 Tax=Methanoregula sp. TaxID=2052170 RepID=UPI002BBD369E|nr:hypothetical protein [Methanoregula sp.]HVP97357.1 hypothetical protein [Methanoregula sp.]
MITMGVATDIMQTFAVREIRAQFREGEGWECRQEQSPFPGSMTFVLSRELRGKKQIIPLAVSYEETPSTIPLEHLIGTLTGKKLTGKCMLVPKGANVTALPGDVRVFFMDSFGFVDEKLVWLTKKKNTKQYCRSEVPAAPETAIPVFPSHTA